MMTRSLAFRSKALFVCATLLFSVPHVFANNAASQVANGRKNLAKQSSAGIHAAHKNFAAALKASPDHPEANFFYAVTLILKEHSSKKLADELGALGVTIQNANPYDYDFSYRQDKSGAWIPPQKSRSNRGLNFLYSNRSLAREALEKLQKIRKRNFRLVLSTKETSLDPVSVDYADILFLRAIVQTGLGLLELQSAYNLNLEFHKVYLQTKAQGITPQMVLNAHPNFFHFTSQAARRLEARTRFLAANKDAQAAMEFIKKSRKLGNPTNLFHPEEMADLNETAQVLDFLARSMLRPTKIPAIGDESTVGDNGTLVGRQVDLSRLITTANSPRSWIPNKFRRGYIRQNSWRDRTLGGVLPDIKSEELDRLVHALGALDNIAPEPYTFSTIAGRGGVPGYAGKNGTVLFGEIAGMVIGPDGCAYLADGRNHVIRRVTPEGKSTDFAGKRWTTDPELWKLQGELNSTDPNSPSGIFYNFGGGLAFDSGGNLYFTADGRLIKRSKTNGRLEFFQKDINSFNWPTYIAVDQPGNIYVCDYGAVKKVTPQMGVSILAGRMGDWGYKNGPGSQARFEWLEGITVDRSGNIYVSDAYNRVIRKITSAGMVSTHVGIQNSHPEPLDQVGIKALCGYPSAITIDSKGNLFFADEELVRKVSPNGKVTTIGGKHKSFGRRDGKGEAARFGSESTTGIGVDRKGHVFLTDRTTLRRGIPAK